jgi:hypothetical protein
MVKRITVTEAERHSARFPAGRWADLRIWTTDGRVLHSGDVHARGGPEAPFSRADTIGKYIEFAAPVLGNSRAAALQEGVLGLTAPGSRFAELAPLLYEPLTARA